MSNNTIANKAPDVSQPIEGVFSFESTTSPNDPASVLTTPTIASLNFDKRNDEMILIMSREDHAGLSTTDCEKVQANAVSGMNPKFSMHDDLTKQFNQGAGFLLTNLDFLQQLKRLHERLHAYGMIEVFFMYEVDSTTLQVTSTAKRNLITDYSDVTVDQVRANSRMYSTFGDRVIQENLQWSKQLILNSCDNTLRGRIETQTAAFPSSDDTGPVTFFLLTSLIVSTSACVSRAIVTGLSALTFPDFPGEDVDQLAATIRGAVLRLKTCKKVPLDLPDIVLEIFDTCTVEKFHHHFDTLQVMHDPIGTETEKLLNEGSRVYHDLLLREKWLPLSEPGSAFMGKTTIEEQRTTTITEEKVPPKEDSKLRTHDKAGRVIDRTPPAKGAAVSRTRDDGVSEHWCGTCGRWGNHPTTGHADFLERKKARRQPKKENEPPVAGLAADNAAKNAKDANGAAPPPAANLQLPAGYLAKLHPL